MDVWGMGWGKLLLEGQPADKQPALSSRKRNQPNKTNPKQQQRKNQPQTWRVRASPKGDVHVYLNIKTDRVDAGIQWDMAIPTAAAQWLPQDTLTQCWASKLSEFAPEKEQKGDQEPADLFCPPSTATDVVQMKGLLSFLMNIYHPKVTSWQWTVVSSHEKAQKMKILNNLLKKKSVAFFFTKSSFEC